MTPLMKKVISESASKEEEKELGRLWQERIRKIMVDYGEMSELIEVREGSQAPR